MTSTALNVRLSFDAFANSVNEFRFQWGRDNETQFSQPPLPGEPTNSVGGRSPQTFIHQWLLSFGIPEFLERAAFPDERRWQFADTVTLTHGNHTFKFGGDINFVKDIINNLRFIGGEFNYTGANAINDFIVDYTNFTTNGAIRALPAGASGLVGVCPRASSTTAVADTHPRAASATPAISTQGFGVARSDDEDDGLQLLHSGRLARYSATDAEPRFALRVPANPDPINA